MSITQNSSKGHEMFTYIAILALLIVPNLSQVCNTPPYTLPPILQNLMKEKQVSETKSTFLFQKIQNVILMIFGRLSTPQPKNFVPFNDDILNLY